MKDRRIFLQHLAECLTRIREYTAEGSAAFLSDRKTQDAVIRNLEIIGQIVRDLGPETLAARRPEVPWIRIAGARNILAHQYLGVDLFPGLEYRRTRPGGARSRRRGVAGRITPGGFRRVERHYRLRNISASNGNGMASMSSASR